MYPHFENYISKAAYGAVCHAEAKSLGNLMVIIGEFKINKLTLYIDI